MKYIGSVLAKEVQGTKNIDLSFMSADCFDVDLYFELYTFREEIKGEIAIVDNELI